MRNLKIILLTLIIAGAAVLRLYKLAEVPPSLNWDETAAGYNAYTIANWGADEYGNKFPITFKSFGDDKHPVHIYITALFVKVFGLDEFITRFPSAFFGILTVAAMYFLVKKMFKSELAGLLSSLFLAISPYHIQLSRGLWEANFALAFYVFGLMFFYTFLEKKKWMLPTSVFCFGLSFFSYHSSKVLVPPTLILLGILYFKKIAANKKVLVVSALILLLFAGLTIKDPKILGFARVEQNKFQEADIKETSIYQKTKSEVLGKAEIVFDSYKTYFYPKYLFVSGDINPRNSVNAFGQFYKIDAVLILAGLISLILLRSRGSLVVASWLLLSPAPGALTGGPQNAIRACFVLGVGIILSSLGAAKIITLVKRKFWYAVLAFLILVPLFWEFGKYTKYYYTAYWRKNAIEWQYGMKQIVKYLKRNPGSTRVYMDKIRQQPYIFFLYYLKTPLPELLKTVQYDQSESKSYNSVVSFDKYQFGGDWNIIDSIPECGVLYIMTPSYHSGLRFAADLETMELIKYPDGSDAFYMVEGCK